MKNLLSIFIILFLFSEIYAQSIAVSTDEIIKLKEAGFSEKFLQEIISFSEIKITIDEMIKLKDNGISEDIIISAAGTKKKESGEDLNQLTADEWYDKGIAAFKNKNKEDAIKYLENAVELDKRHDQARAQLAYIYFKKLMIKESLKHYDYLDINELSGSLLYDLALAKIIDGQTQGAIRVLEILADKGAFEDQADQLIDLLEDYTVETELSENTINLEFKDEDGQPEKKIIISWE
jgi:tetratricopeptide (TPR) repeat protein